MKLYRVDVSHTLFVRAASEDEACFIAKDTMRDISFDQEADETIAAEVTQRQQVPPEWRNSIPYCEGDSDDKTVAEILAEQGEKP